MTVDAILNRSMLGDSGSGEPGSRDEDSTLTMSRSRGEHPILVLALGGELDISTAPALLRYAGSALTARRRTTAIVLDLTELGFVSAAGLRAVNRICASAGKGGLRAMVVAPWWGPVGALRETGERAVLGEVFETRRAAIAAAERKETRPLARSERFHRSARSRRRRTMRELSAVPA
jgi:anti-anti-sigma factor